MSAATAPHLLSRSARRSAQKAQPGQPLLARLQLARARVHEFCGSARRSLAMTLAADMQGSICWIQPGWATDRLNPDGIRPFLDPARLIFVTPKRPEDVLWSMEEVLRSGAVPLVVADLPTPPGLTPVRRLHLAAETGAEAGTAPLGLILTPGQGGAQGIESRWELQPAHRGEALPDQGWTLHRRRARTAPEQTWMIARGSAGLTLAPHASEGETHDNRHSHKKMTGKRDQAR